MPNNTAIPAFDLSASAARDQLGVRARRSLVLVLGLLISRHQRGMET